METKTYPVEHGAMTDVPIYENHERGTNWLAKISPNPSAPGGLDREFVERGRGKYYYLVADLEPGTPVEFGADYRTSGGRKRPNRWYGVVARVATDAIEFAPANDADEAFALAEEMEDEIPTINRLALKDERDALVARLAEIDEALGREWVVVARYGVKMVARGNEATIYYRDEEIYHGEFYAAGRVCNAKIKEVRPRRKAVPIALSDATPEQVWLYAVSMYDAGYGDPLRGDEDMQRRAERYRKMMEENGETTISYDVLEEWED